jgi:hypothetical protein
MPGNGPNQMFVRHNFQFMGLIAELKRRGAQFGQVGFCP